MTSAIPTICLWIPFVARSALPLNATLGGFYFYGKETAASHVYVMRAWYDGELVTTYRSHSGAVIYPVDFKRGTDKPITYRTSFPANAEILTCNTEIGELRWLKFEPKMDLENCIEYGRAPSGETGYVGRTFVRLRTDESKFGIIPGFFLPSEGFIIVWFDHLHHSFDVELLCAI